MNYESISTMLDDDNNDNEITRNRPPLRQQ